MEEQITSLEDVEALMEESDIAMSAGAFNASLLLLWAAAEAVMRIRLGSGSLPPDIKVPVTRLTPSVLVSSFYTAGEIDPKEYDTLLTGLRLRNETAHGRSHKASGEDVRQLQSVVRRILKGAEPEAPRGGDPQIVREMVGGEPYEYVPVGEYIVRAPGVCGGRPTFKYTRIEPAGTLGRLAAGEDIDKLVAGYRGRVPREAIQEAVDITIRGILSGVPETAEVA